MTQPCIRELLPLNLVGHHIQTSLSVDRTRELWQGFRPRIKEITGRIDANFYSVQQYPEGFSLETFTPATVFERWAAVAVEQADQRPEGMDVLRIPAGLYAVFTYKGPAHAFAPTWQYIFGVWLPQSAYVLDERPHFEVLGPEYRPDDPNAQEEVWVPVRGKAN